MRTHTLREYAIGKTRSTGKTKSKKTTLANSILAALVLPTAPGVLFAQAEVEEKAIEEVVVTAGPRSTIQKSIELKRNSLQIVDGLNAEEIGEIPALSIGEALETLTGAASHRENGGATEVSIRGLGPFLTSTVFNGRGATNGAGNRAVNFSIFPSELFNKVAIHKTQSASNIEGAVGGQIHLDTRRPIEYGKERFQFGLKGAYNEGQQDVVGASDIGHRATASYINSFETEDYGTFGFSIGFQTREESDPEQEFTRSNTPRICDVDNGVPTSTVCSDNERELRDPDPSTDREFAFLSNSAVFRQNRAEDERNAVFGALQWQPDDRWDLNLDFQWSERIQDERRSDLVFSELNRNLNNATSVDVSGGFLQSFEDAQQEIQLIGQDFVRDEKYKGIGFNVEYLVNDDLEVSFDVAYSDTRRVETEESLRLADEVERVVSADFTRGDVGIFEVTQIGGAAFDASDLGEFLSGATADGVGSTAEDFQAAFANDGDFDDRLRARVQEDIRDNTLLAYRGDFDWQTYDLGVIKSIEGGVRVAEMEYSRKGNINSDFNLNNDALGGGGSVDQANLLAAIANNCIDGPIDNDFTEVSSSQGERFLNYNSIDAGCSLDLVRLALEARGESTDPLTPNNKFNGSSVDVEESTYAAYIKFNYESELFGFPARGDFGLRVVRTSVDSRSFSTPFRLDYDDSDGGSFELDSGFGSSSITVNKESHSYTNYLPSASLVLDLKDDLLFRAGIFRGISRSDPAILGTRQQVGTVQRDIEDAATLGGENLTLDDIRTFITTQGRSGGSADLDAFTSWNVDLALEWYPNSDTILAAGVYFKRFKGGYQNTFVENTFTVVSDGSSDTIDVLNTNLSGDFADGAGGVYEITAPISSVETTDESSNLYGFELSASHSLAYLDGFLGGFGGKLGYNFADSDFEFEDDFAGAGVGFDDAGNEVQLVGLVPPADIFGLSRHVFSGQIYWDNGIFDAAVLYKYRSQYFQQFVDDPGRIRYTDDNAVVEFKSKLRLNKNIQLTFEALNITDEPRIDYRGLEGNIANVYSYGARYFLGVRGKF